MTTERKIQIHEDCLEVLGRIKAKEFDLRMKESLLSSASMEDKEYRENLTNYIKGAKEAILSLNALYEIRVSRLTEVIKSNL